MTDPQNGRQLKTSYLCCLQAVAAALEAVSTLSPTAPVQPLLHVLLSLNKVHYHFYNNHYCYYRNGLALFWQPYARAVQPEQGVLLL